MEGKLLNALEFSVGQGYAIFSFSYCVFIVGSMCTARVIIIEYIRRVAMWLLIRIWFLEHGREKHVVVCVV